jgi:hypothetical protein
MLAPVRYRQATRGSLDRRPGASETFRRWLLFGLQDSKGTHQGSGAAGDAHLEKRVWWRVMCLTGVDYFPTLGFQPADNRPTACCFSRRGSSWSRQI